MLVFVLNVGFQVYYVTGLVFGVRPRLGSAVPVVTFASTEMLWFTFRQSYQFLVLRVLLYCGTVASFCCGNSVENISAVSGGMEVFMAGKAECDIPRQLSGTHGSGSVREERHLILIIRMKLNTGYSRGQIIDFYMKSN